MEPNQSPEMTDQLEVEQLIERFAPKLAAEEPKTMRLLVIGEDGPDPRLLERVRELGRQKGLDLIVLTADDVPEQKPKSDHRRMAIVDRGHISLAKVLAEALKSVSCAYEEPAEAPCEVDALHQPQAMAYHQKARDSSFRQFQNKQRNQGPPVRRQFAQIRPPRRGGR